MAIYALGDRVPCIHPDAYVHPDAVVIGAVELAAGSSVWPRAVLRGDYGTIHIGARTSIQDGSVLHTTEQWPTIVGADCVVGHLAHLEGCVVEDHCLIGSGSIVLNRARIQSRGAVAAGALVRMGQVVPPEHLAVGVPARLTPYEYQDEWMTYAVSDYVNNAIDYRANLRRVDVDG